jgi:hypothetical protein
MTMAHAVKTTDSSDSELVTQSLAGNRDAFGWIVSRYQSLLCSLAYSATGSLSQSEDLAQETFITAWKQLADLREPEKLRSCVPDLLKSPTMRCAGRDGNIHCRIDGRSGIACTGAAALRPHNQPGGGGYSLAFD